MKPLFSNVFSRLWRATWVLAAAMAVAIMALTAPLPASDALAADTPIGTVTKKRMDVYGTSVSHDRERLYPNDTVHFGELLETSGGGAMMVRFEDETELFLGERAKLVIDDFIYDPESNQGRAVYNFSVGTLRFVSGKMVEDEISILTPNANIGIRGSEAIIFVTPKGETIVNVMEGRFSVRSRDRPDAPAVNIGKNENVSLTGSVDFSPIGQGVKLPEYSHDLQSTDPDFSDDFYDLKDGGGLDTAREGRDAGTRSNDTSGHTDGGDHHSAPD